MVLCQENVDAIRYKKSQDIYFSLIKLSKNMNLTFSKEVVRSMEFTNSIKYHFMITYDNFMIVKIG